MIYHRSIHKNGKVIGQILSLSNEDQISDDEILWKFSSDEKEEDVIDVTWLIFQRNPEKGKPIQEHRVGKPKPRETVFGPTN